MRICLRRREFVTALGGAAVWPLAARGQQRAMPVIGLLNPGSPEAGAFLAPAFREGLSETGYVEGRNVAIERRFAQNEYNRLPELAADLVRRRVAVIVARGSTAAALAAKAATTTIPIVFATGADPVETGLVASLNRPGGNVSGVSSMSNDLAAKRLGLLHELLPGAARFAVLVNPNPPVLAEPTINEVQAAGLIIRRQIEILTASNSREIDAAFATLVQKRVDALLITPDALFGTRRAQIVSLAARHAVPAIYTDRQYTEIGGLMSYASSIAERDRQAGIYTGRILKGEKPADLPILRATKFDFVINMQTARLLGLTVPPTLLAIADEVIE
jgi:putative ABC transport system substrate-binding protein